jgi:hypothetical protein
MRPGPRLPHLARSVPSPLGASCSRPENRVGLSVAGFVKPNSRPGDDPAEPSEARGSSPGARRMAGGWRPAQAGEREMRGDAEPRAQHAGGKSSRTQTGSRFNTGTGNDSMGYGRRRRRAARGSRSAAAGVRVASGEVGLEHARVHARVQWTRASRVDETLLGGRSIRRWSAAGTRGRGGRGAAGARGDRGRAPGG